MTFEDYDKVMEIERKRQKKKDEGKKDLGDAVTEHVTPQEIADKMEGEEESRKKRYKKTFNIK